VKDWRTAVCTRWRPLTVILLVIIGWNSLGSILAWLDRLPVQSLEKKERTLAVGMTEAELLKIMGPPASKKYEVDRKSLNMDEADSMKVVEYTYSARNIFLDSWRTIDGIFVDESIGKIILIRHSLHLGMAIGDPPSDLVSLFFLALFSLMAALIWLFFKFWCENYIEEDSRQ